MPYLARKLFHRNGKFMWKNFLNISVWYYNLNIFSIILWLLYVKLNNNILIVKRNCHNGAVHKMICLHLEGIRCLANMRLKVKRYIKIVNRSTPPGPEHSRNERIFMHDTKELTRIFQSWFWWYNETYFLIISWWLWIANNVRKYRIKMLHRIVNSERKVRNSRWN